jgi:hypothetical protein
LLAIADRLAHNLAASEIDEYGRIAKHKHYCPYGHHDSPEDALDEIRGDIDKLTLSHGAPAVPACNRWMKPYPAYQWIHGHLVLNVTPPELHSMSLKKEEADQADVMQCNSDLDAILGYATEDSYKAKTRKQLKKTDALIMDPLSKTRLAAAVTSIGPMFQKMGSYLTASKMNNTANVSMLDFANPTTSPAMKAYNIYVGLLEMPEHPHWFLSVAALRITMFITTTTTTSTSTTIVYIYYIFIYVSLYIVI